MTVTDTQPYIKWLHPDGTPAHGGTGRWPLPTQHPDGSWTPGEALRVDGAIVPCQNGLHLCRLNQAAGWIQGVPFLAQYRGELVDAGDKVVVREARLVRRLAWDDRIARHFACDCAERALARITHPDPRSESAVAVARRYADGHATSDELSAARAVARDAAWDAVRDAVRDAAGAAAGAAEREWQGARLWAYFTGQRTGGQ